MCALLAKVVTVRLRPLLSGALATLSAARTSRRFSRGYITGSLPLRLPGLSVCASISSFKIIPRISRSWQGQQGAVVADLVAVIKGRHGECHHPPALDPVCLTCG
jgi:hypothetical protein